MSDSDPAKRAPTAADPEPALRKSSAGRARNAGAKKPVREIGGVDGPEPTRYGDWERNGRCTDF